MIYRQVEHSSSPVEPVRMRPAIFDVVAVVAVPLLNERDERTFFTLQEDKEKIHQLSR